MASPERQQRAHVARGSGARSRQRSGSDALSGAGAGVGGHQDLPAGGHEDVTVVIIESDQPSRSLRRKSAAESGPAGDGRLGAGGWPRSTVHERRLTGGVQVDRSSVHRRCRGGPADSDGDAVTTRDMNLRFAICRGWISWRGGPRRQSSASDCPAARKDRFRHARVSRQGSRHPSAPEAPGQPGRQAGIGAGTPATRRRLARNHWQTHRAAAAYACVRTAWTARPSGSLRNADAAQTGYRTSRPIRGSG